MRHFRSLGPELLVLSSHLFPPFLLIFYFYDLGIALLSMHSKELKAGFQGVPVVAQQ